MHNASTDSSQYGVPGLGHDAWQGLQTELDDEDEELEEEEDSMIWHFALHILEFAPDFSHCSPASRIPLPQIGLLEDELLEEVEEEEDDDELPQY